MSKTNDLKVVNFNSVNGDKYSFKYFRKNLGLTQKEVADKADITVLAYNLIENQKIKKWEAKFDQEVKLKEEEETLKIKQLYKKRHEESKLKEEERISKYDESKPNKLKETAVKMNNKIYIKKKLIIDK